MSTVAEILGWRYVDNPRHDGHWKEPAQQIRTPDGQYWNTTKTPTPDELLTWIHEQGLRWLAETDDDGGVFIYVHSLSERRTIWPDPSTGMEAEGPFSTLHAALEAAVLAIHEQTP